MQSKLIDQALIAAETARQNGFEETYLALIEVVKELTAAKADVGSEDKYPMS